MTQEDARARRRARIRRRLYSQTSTRSAAQLLGPITVAAVLVILVLTGRDVLRKIIASAEPPPIGVEDNPSADAIVTLRPLTTLRAAITVTGKAILVDGQIVARLESGAVRQADVGPDGIVLPLRDRLRVARDEPLPDASGPPWERVAVVTAHRDAPYGVVTAVAATARAAGLTHIEYAAVP